MINKTKAKTIQNNLNKAAPNLSRVRETDNRNRTCINSDMIQLEMLEELKYIADNINQTKEKPKKLELKDLITLIGEDPRPDKQYNQNQLQEGIILELEHKNDVKIAKKIAKDHLDEMPDYYTKLKEIEKK